MWGLQHHCKFIVLVTPNDPARALFLETWCKVQLLSLFFKTLCGLLGFMCKNILCWHTYNPISFWIDGIDLDSSTSMGFIHNFVFYLGSFGISWVMWYFMILDSVSRGQNLETMPPRDGSCRQSHTISSDLLSLWFNPNPYVIWTSCRTWQNHLKWPSLILSLMYSTSTL